LAVAAPGCGLATEPHLAGRGDHTRGASAAASPGCLFSTDLSPWSGRGGGTWSSAAPRRFSPPLGHQHCPQSPSIAVAAAHLVDCATQPLYDSQIRLVNLAERTNALRRKGAGTAAGPAGSASRRPSEFE